MNRALSYNLSNERSHDLSRYELGGSKNVSTSVLARENSKPTIAVHKGKEQCAGASGGEHREAELLQLKIKTLS